jgi:hypothetical protein
MESFNRFFKMALLVLLVCLLPACALFKEPAATATAQPVPSSTPQVEVQEPSPAPPVAAATAPAVTAVATPAPSRYMQLVKEKKPLFEMDMKTEPACKGMASSFGGTSPSERASASVRCNTRSVSAALPVSAVMKNPKSKSNYLARFRNKESCTRVLETLAQSGRGTVVRDCADRKKV